MELTPTHEWRKAGRSGDNGGHCVEVAMLSVTGGDADHIDRI
jgi:Domain of unknown function (DUF397)